MGRPFRLPFGPFDHGLNNALDPTLLPPGGAVTATNVDLSAGTLRGFYGPGSPLSGSGAPLVLSSTNAKGLLYAADSYWSGNAHWLWGCPDYDVAGYKSTTWVTSFSLSGGVPVAGVGRQHIPSTTTARVVGVTAPAAGSLTVAAGSAGSNTVTRRYAYTYVTADGWESNPVFSHVPGSGGPGSASKMVTLTVANSPDANVVAKNIYCTEAIAGDTTDLFGPLYYLNQQADNTTTTLTDFDAGTAYPDLTRPLIWTEDGNVDNEQYPDDNAPAPRWAIVSDALHSVTEGSGASGAGILVFATYADGETSAITANAKVVGWTKVGKPWASPARNRWPSPDEIRAIKTDLAQTLIFTGNSVYALSGTDDRYMRMDKLSAGTGVKRNCGPTVARSPYGIFFSSPKGLMLLREQSAVPVAGDRLAPSYWNGLTDIPGLGPVQAGAFYGDHYFLAHGGGTLIFDFSAYPNVRITTSDTLLTALHVTPFDSAEYGQGLYVCKYNDFSGTDTRIRPWMPDKSTARGSRLSWVWKTGEITGHSFGVDPNALKRFRTVLIRKESNSTPTMKVYYDGTLVHARTLGSGKGEGKDWARLPATRARSIAIQWEGAGTDEVYGFEIEGEVVG